MPDDPASLAYQLRDGKTPHQIAKEHGWTLTYTLEQLALGKREIERQLKRPTNPWANDTK